MAADLPDLRQHWLMEVEDHTLGARRHRPGATDLPQRGELDRRRAVLTEDSLGGDHTSGTTGRPGARGDPAASRRVTSAIECCERSGPGGATLFHRWPVFVHATVGPAQGRPHGAQRCRRITRDLPTFRPTFVLAVPRVFDRSRRRTPQGRCAGRVRVFDLAAATAIAYSTSRAPGQACRCGCAAPVRPPRLRQDQGRLRRTQPGRSRAALRSAAPRAFLPRCRRDRARGWTHRDPAAATVNTRKATRIGSVGKALPRFEISISDDGEVLVRGGRDRGYWHDAAATTAVLDADGWFHTGPRSLDVMASSRSRGGRSPGRRRARA